MQGLNRQLKLTHARLSQIDKKQPDIVEPIYWSGRIASFHDFQNPATSWYLITPPHRGGNAHFIGYDPISRGVVGYIGLDGFLSQPPAIDRSFQIKHHHWAAYYGSIVASQNPYSYFQVAFEPSGRDVEIQYAPKVNASPDLVWILSNGTIHEVRLKTRTVNTIVKDRPDIRELAQFTYEDDGKSYLKLIVRAETELLILDPDTRTMESIKVVQVSPEDSFEFYQLKNGHRVLTRSPKQDLESVTNHQQIYWLDENGQIERQAEANLVRQLHTAGISESIYISILFPIPILPNAIATIGPLINPALFQGKSYDPLPYSQMVWKAYQDSAIWIALSILVGLLTGLVCRRREVDVFGNHGWMWPIIVGVTGWFGWMGYICVRPLPARLPNRQWMPNQPEPVRPIGTEIFA
jgi:hypothetical protein